MAGEISSTYRAIGRGQHERDREVRGEWNREPPHAIELYAGDLLVVYSDGVSEALNDAGDEFGESRVNDTVDPNWLEPSDVVLQTLLQAVRSFAHGAPQNDDVTALIVRYTPGR